MLRKGAYTTVKGSLQVGKSLDMYRSSLTVKGSAFVKEDIDISGFARYSSKFGFLIAGRDVTVRRGKLGKFFERHEVGGKLERLFGQGKGTMSCGTMIGRGGVFLEGVSANEVVGRSVTLDETCSVTRVKFVDSCEAAVEGVQCEKISEDELKEIWQSAIEGI